jgi:pentatricopeptide repeat protein
VFMYGALFKGKCKILHRYLTPSLMILGYVFNGMPEKVLEMIGTMSVQPDGVIATMLFNACSKIAHPHAIDLGKRVLNQLPAAFLEDPVLVTAAIDMLMRFGDVRYTEHLFSKLQRRDAASYGVMMNGYNINGLPDKALDLFDQVSSMLNANLYTIMYSTCAGVCNERAITLGKELLRGMPHTFKNELIVMGSAIHMLMKFGEVQEAEHLFSQMGKQGPSTYGVMMNGYNINGLPDKALDLFDQVSSMLNANLYTIMYSTCAGVCNERAITLGKELLRGMPHTFKNELIVMGSAIHMLMKFGEVQEAEHLFSQMGKQGPSTYGVMMNGYNINGLPDKALDLFDQASCMLNANLYTIMYSTCAALSDDRAITFGKGLLDKMPKMLNNNSIVMGSAIHMLMKFGEVQEAEHLFTSMKKRDVASYGIMMNGYNINSEVQKCLKLFEEAKRQKIKIDERIYASLIGAYSKIGMISMCRNIVKQIPKDSLNSHQVKNSLIDMWVSALRTVHVESTSTTLLLIRENQVRLMKPSKCFNRSASLLRWHTPA